MKNFIVGFIIGAGVGAGATYIWHKKTYDKALKKEIEAINEAYLGYGKHAEEKKVEDEKVETPTLVRESSLDGFAEREKARMEADELAQTLGYSGDQQKVVKDPVSTFKDKMNEMEENEKLETENLSEGKYTIDNFDPYIIPEEEYGHYDNYDHWFVTYYSDGIFADEYDNRIQDVRGLLGEKIMFDFTEGNTKEAWVRNEERFCDIHITVSDDPDIKTYAQLLDLRPYLRDREGNTVEDY